MMNLLRSVVVRLRNLVSRSRLEAEMAQEMRSHLEMQEQLNRAQGMSPDEARAAAHRQFGNLDSVQERSRDVRGITWILDLWGDVRFGFRMLRKTPGFAITVILTLAFGIAVNTTLFSMVNVFFLQPLSLKGGDRLVRIAQRSKFSNFPVPSSFPDFRDLREQLTSVEDLVAFTSQPASLSAPGKSAERAWIQVITPDAFEKYGVAPAQGRTLQPSDGETSGAANVVVITHQYWQNKMGADPKALGSTVLVNGKPFTVVGITREDFHSFAWAMQMSAFLPSGAIEQLSANGKQLLENRGNIAWNVLGRLKEGADLKTARSQTAVISERLRKTYPDFHDAKSSLVVFKETSARPDPALADVAPAFAVFFCGMVVLVLVIACANVTNLMIARATTREREFAMRSALGATRPRLMRQLMVESLLLASIAGVLGWYLGAAGGYFLATFMPAGDLPTAANFQADGRQYGFAVLITAVTGVLSGLIPALRASRVDLLTALRQSGNQQNSGRKHRLRNLLVSGQVACSLVVLISAALFLRSLYRAQTIQLGFTADHLAMMSVDLEMQGYSAERGTQFINTALERIRALPQVEGATVSQHVPFETTSMFACVAYPENAPRDMKDGNTTVNFSRVDPSFHTTLAVSLLRGRALADTDQPNTPRVAVINEAMAKLCWPNADPIGKRFRMWWAEGPWAEVVGVVPTGKYNMVGESPRPYFFTSWKQDYAMPTTFLVRAKTDPAAVTSAVRDVLHNLDSNLPVYNVRTMEAHLRDSLFAFMPMRMGATMAGTQGAIALVLAIIGLYSVVSYGVHKRIQEIGIRMALGASEKSVTKLVVRDGIRLTTTGLIMGGIFAVLIGLALSKILFGLPAFDVLAFGGVTSLLLLTTALACWWPARRAARVNPNEALRFE